MLTWILFNFRIFYFIRNSGEIDRARMPPTESLHRTRMQRTCVLGGTVAGS